MLAQDAAIGTYKGNPIGLSSWLTPTELCCPQFDQRETEDRQPAYKPPPPPHNNSSPHNNQKPPPKQSHAEPGLIEKLFGSLNGSGELPNLLKSLFGKDFRLDAPTLLGLLSKDGGLQGLMNMLGGLFKKPHDAEQTVNLRSYKRVD